MLFSNCWDFKELTRFTGLKIVNHIKNLMPYSAFVQWQNTRQNVLLSNILCTNTGPKDIYLSIYRYLLSLYLLWPWLLSVRQVLYHWTTSLSFHRSSSLMAVSFEEIKLGVMVHSWDLSTWQPKPEQSQAQGQLGNTSTPFLKINECSFFPEIIKRKRD